jgi:hypothetical protein
MVTTIIDTDPRWISTIDFTRSPTFNCRTEELQIRRCDLDLLGWSVFVVLAPLDGALYLLRTYEAFDMALRSYFYARRGNTLDTERVKIFESQLRELKIAKKSEHAIRCFGLYPRLWGDRFLPTRQNAFAAQRLLSIAVPSDAAHAVANHLKDQLQEFDANVTCAVDESVSLIYGTQSHITHGLLLLELTGKMSREARREIRVELERLVQSADARSQLVRQLDPLTLIGGLIRTPDLRDIVEGCSDSLAITRLRVHLAIQLSWPHTLERMRSDLMQKPISWLQEEFVPLLSSALGQFRCVSENPLQRYLVKSSQELRSK